MRITSIEKSPSLRSLDDQYTIAIGQFSTHPIFFGNHFFVQGNGTPIRRRKSQGGESFIKVATL
ncbi:MAG: hypothetical protein VCA18_13905 [Opitutales bacterium]